MADDAHRSKISSLFRLCGKIASSNTSSFKTVKLILSYYRGGNYALQSKDSHHLEKNTKLEFTESQFNSGSIVSLCSFILSCTSFL